MIGDVKGDKCVMIDINALISGLSCLELSILRYNCGEVIKILEKKRVEESEMSGLESLGSKRWDNPTKYMPFCTRLKGIFHRDLDFKNFEKENDRCFNEIAMILKSFACCSRDECSEEMQKLIVFFESIKAIAGDQHIGDDDFSDEEYSSNIIPDFPAACRGHKAMGDCQGGEAQLFPLDKRGDLFPVRSQNSLIPQPKPTTPPREQRYPIRLATSSGEHLSCTSSLFTVRDRGLNVGSRYGNEEEAVTSLSSVPGPSQPVNLKK